METTDSTDRNADEPSVLTVPMRNGNKVSSSSSERATYVLTVPMRNGNASTGGVSEEVLKFLPYL